MMHGGPLKDQNDHSNAATANALVTAFERAFSVCNNVIVILAAIALIAACVILSDSVLSRALFHSANYWQDEAAVFLLVGATFMTSAYVQGQRGHIGIEAFVGLLSPTVNRIRLWLVDVASFLFCAFFAWKSWTLAHEAWVDGQDDVLMLLRQGVENRLRHHQRLQHEPIGCAGARGQGF